MSGFHDVRFPADISFKATGGPEFKTDITQLASGQEKRNASWQIARARYKIDFKDISRTQSTEVINFFYARRGMSNAFRFKDWNDFEAKQQVIGIGDNIKTEFQLVKNYGEDDYIYQRSISRPVSGSVSVYSNGAEQSGSCTVDHNAGSVIFTAPPEDGAVITATFQFDVPVRFNSDSLNNEIETYGNNSIRKIELIEVKN